MVGTVAAFAFALTCSPQNIKQPTGFLATPTGATKRQAVLVLHPWWGLNADVKSVCRQLAKEGFLAFAPDLFNGKVATTILEAEALIKGARSADVEKLVGASAKYLYAKKGKPISVVGFSFGAAHALQLSNNDPQQVKSVVIFYGTGVDDFSKSKASYLGHFAEQDEFEPQAAVDGLKQALQKWNRPTTIHTYPGTGHWFFEPSRKDAYNKSASNLAWQRTLAFLKKAS